MSARLTFTTPPKFVKHFIAAHLALADSSVPRGTLELMNIRASQINGCGACLDMHTKEAAHAGETALRMNLVGAWRETTVFTDAELLAVDDLPGRSGRLRARPHPEDHTQPMRRRNWSRTSGD